MSKKKPVQNDYWYVIVPTNEMTPFRDLQKAIEQAKAWSGIPFQVLKVTKSWVIAVPKTPEPAVREENAEDMWLYDE